MSVMKFAHKLARFLQVVRFLFPVWQKTLARIPLSLSRSDRVSSTYRHFYTQVTTSRNNTRRELKGWGGGGEGIDRVTNVDVRFLANVDCVTSLNTCVTFVIFSRYLLLTKIEILS